MKRRGGWLSVLLILGIFFVFPIKTDAVTTVIRAGYNNGYPNYQFAKDGETPEGLHIDVMNWIAGNNDLEIEYVPYAYDTACIEALENGEIDIIVGINGAMFLGTDYVKTSPISSSTICLIASNAEARHIEDRGSTSGLLCAAERGHLTQALSMQGTTTQSGFRKNTFLVMNNQEETIKYLVNGDVSIAICEKNSAVQMLEDYGKADEFSIVYNYLADTEAVIAVRGTDRMLYDVINRGIAQIRSSGEYEKLHEKWIVVEETFLNKRSVRLMLAFIAALLSGVAIYVRINSHIKKTLELKVEEKTEELQVANEALSHNMNRLEKEYKLRSRIIEDSPSSMFIIEEDGTIQFMNERAMRVFGIRRGDGRNIHVSESRHLQELMKKIRDSEGDQPAIIQIENGSRKIYRCSTYRITGKNDTADMLCSIEDVTTEERQKQEMFEAEKNRSLNTIIAGLSHEIKNPLTAIKAYTEILPEHVQDTEFLETLSKTVPKETERINMLIESLINYARPNVGVKEEVEMSTLIRSCIALLMPIAKKAGAEIRFYFDEPLIIKAYVEQLRQAIINYLMNAVESLAMKRETSEEALLLDIRLGKTRDNTRMFIHIYDNGIGMNDEEKEQCMDLFYTTKARGTGMGMPVALQGVSKNGGRVTIETEKGQYTRIEMEFDLDIMM